MSEPTEALETTRASEAGGHSFHDPAGDSAKDQATIRRFGLRANRFMLKWRALIARYPWLNMFYKVIVTVIGVAIIIAGLILVPLPGPGWLIVFVGLTILGSEFHWARRFTGWLRITLAGFWDRVKTMREARAQDRQTK